MMDWEQAANDACVKCHHVGTVGDENAPRIACEDCIGKAIREAVLDAVEQTACVCELTVGDCDRCKIVAELRKGGQS